MKTTAALLAAANVASARIIGFAAPLTVAPDSQVKLEILTENYIQSIQDVSMSFGISPANTSYPGSLGTLFGSKTLGPDLSNDDQNITHYVHIPATFPKGDGVIQAAHFSLTGASLSPATELYTLNVTVGDNTSSEYVRSSPVQT